MLEKGRETKDKLEVALLRKLDLRLIPLLSVLYLLSYIDRSNIGNASLGGLQRDLGLTHQEYQWCLSIFFFGYIIFEIPSNIVMRRWRPSNWLGLLMGSWGIIATAMAACRTFAGLAICRFLLGACEAGFFPGVIYFLSVWYTRKEYGRRMGLFWSFGSLAGAFGGLFAYAISQIPDHRLASWQWLFIIEGAPSVALAGFAAWYLPNSPETCRFLSEDERALEIRRLAADAKGGHPHQEEQEAAGDHFSWAAVLSVFSDWKLYVYMLIYFLGTCSLQGVTLFLPSIVAGMGTWSPVEAQALTTPPYCVAFVATLAIAYSSDRLFERSWHMILTNLVGIAGFAILLLVDVDRVALRYFGACIVVGSVYGNVAPKVAWFNNNFGGLTRRAIASAAIVSVGMVGGALGGQIYYDPPQYQHGNQIALACLAAQSVIVLLLRFAFMYENRRRDKLDSDTYVLEIQKYGGPDMAGDRHPDFRYVL
ncbi:major facilitator superfamily domain-containing protein [Dichotomocladium elegans]|nr:major facilitator superfamily domain-containing protein [Dichotomocladium elegans]